MTSACKDAAPSESSDPQSATTSSQNASASGAKPPAGKLPIQNGFFQSPEAQAELARTRQEIGTVGYPSHANVERLKALYRQFPDAEPVVKSLDNALTLLNDWDGLYQLHSSRPRSQRTAYQKFYIGYILTRLTRYEEAIDIFEPLLLNNPDDRDCALLAVSCYVALQLYDEAEKLLDDPRLKLDEFDPGATATFRGQVYLHQQKPELAREQFETALRLNPDSASAAINLGRAMQLLGNTEQAEHYAALSQQLADAYSFKTTWTSNLWTLTVEWHAESWPACLRRVDYLLAMVDDPASLSMLHWLRGNIFARQDMKEKAVAELEKAKAFDAQMRESPPSKIPTHAKFLMSRVRDLTAAGGNP